MGNKKRTITILLAVLTVILVSLAMFGCAEYRTIKNSDKQVKVILRDCEGMRIKSAAEKNATVGGSVSFEIEIDDDYMYLGNTAGASYKNGILTILRADYPTTIDVILTPRSELIHLTLMSNDVAGYAGITEGDEWMVKPDAVTVKSSVTAGISFSGWSEGGFLSDGGTLVSTDPQYTFYIKENTVLYANFVNKTHYTIVYHANGGTVEKLSGDTQDNSSSEQKDTYTVKKKYSTLFSMQQTLHSNGRFIRNGYVAIGYSTEPADYESYAGVNSIPGFSNMGGVCDVGDYEKYDLYVVWAKTTSHTKFVVNNGVITGYKGNDKIIVIPEVINGRVITGIDPNVFSCSVERIVIPKTVKVIAKKAFVNCTSLREVVFFDSVESVYNESFSNCKNIQTICLNSQRLPRYSNGTEGGFCLKYERVRTLEGKKIVVVSGSSTLNGLNSAQMEKNFPGYSVVNYGTNAQNSSAFFLDAISNYVNEGDIIIHAPEFTGGNPMGGNRIQPKLFRGNEQCYDIFREVDMRNYVDFFDSWGKFQVGDPDDSTFTPALSLPEREYQLNVSMNIYGDLGGNRVGTLEKHQVGTNGSGLGTLTPTQLNRINAQITAKGGIMLMSFGTMDKSYFRLDQANQETFDKYTKDCQAKIDYPVISNVGTYIMEHKYFYDSMWHCNLEGADVRTENLTKDLRAYLESVGIE